MAFLKKCGEVTAECRLKPSLSEMQHARGYFTVQQLLYFVSKCWQPKLYIISQLKSTCAFVCKTFRFVHFKYYVSYFLVSGRAPLQLPKLCSAGSVLVHLLKNQGCFTAFGSWSRSLLLQKFIALCGSARHPGVDLELGFSAKDHQRRFPSCSSCLVRTHNFLFSWTTSKLNKIQIAKHLLNN